MAGDIVKLSKLYTAHETSFRRLVFREPTYKEMFMDGLGQPVEWQITKGEAIRVVYPLVVDAYVQQLLVEPSYECIAGLNAADSLKVQGKICDFFLVFAASKTSSTGSSSEERSTSKPPKE